MALDDAANVTAAEIESGHTTGRMSARRQRIEVISRGERWRRWSIEQWILEPKHRTELSVAAPRTCTSSMWEMSMTPNAQRLVRDSFAKVAPNAEAAAGMFYDRLFVLDLSLRPLFKDDMIE